MNEKEKLQAISERSLYSDGVMQSAIDYCFKVFARHLQGSSILEMGPAEGMMTERLSATGHDLTIVEGSELFCQSLKSRFPKANVHHALFEEFTPSRTFDNIVLGHVLEHVEDPVDVLRRAGSWLKEGGQILAAVPNAKSLHRQAAVLMGLLPVENGLNEMDQYHGHRRVFDPASFQDCFIQAGLRVSLLGGYWLKPLSNGQLKQSWTPEMLEAFMALGEKYPEIAGEIYAVAVLR